MIRLMFEALCSTSVSNGGDTVLSGRSERKRQTLLSEAKVRPADATLVVKLVRKF